MFYRHSLETTLLRKHKILMHPLVKAGVLTDSSFPSVIPWETWLALLSASFTRPMCRSCLSVSVSTMKISGAFQSNGLSRNSSVIANLLTMLSKALQPTLTISQITTIMCRSRVKCSSLFTPRIGNSTQTGNNSEGNFHFRVCLAFRSGLIGLSNMGTFLSLSWGAEPDKPDQGCSAPATTE